MEINLERKIKKSDKHSKLINKLLDSFLDFTEICY